MENQQSISEWANETFGPAGIATLLQMPTAFFLAIRIWRIGCTP